MSAAAPPQLPSKLPPPRRRRWKTIALVLLVFVSGLAIGGAGATIFIARQVRLTLQHPDQIPARLTTRLTRRLNLSPSQADGVHRLLDQRLARLQTLRQKFQSPFRVELDGFHADVRQLLDPAQQTIWDGLFDDLIHNWLPPLAEFGGPTTMPASP